MAHVGRQPEDLEPVAPVPLEHLVDDAPDRSRPGDPALVARRHPPVRALRPAADPARDPAEAGHERRGHELRGPRRAAVRVRRQLPSYVRPRTRVTAGRRAVRSGDGTAGAGPRPGAPSTTTAAGSAGRSTPRGGTGRRLRAARPAWRYTCTNRWIAVKPVSTSISHSIGHEDGERERDAEEHEALGPLHQPAAGLEAERLGPGPLVGDQHRARGDGEREDRQVRRLRPRGTRRRRRTATRRTRGR